MDTRAPHLSIEIGPADFDLAAEYQQLVTRAGDAGAVVTFVGLVREMADKRPIQELYLEHYPGMTEKLIGGILGEAADRGEILAARVIHRVGPIEPGDPIVLVAVWAAHRREAFEGGRAIMEALKSRAPFWKHEQTETGGRWVEQNTRG